MPPKRLVFLEEQATKQKAVQRAQKVRVLGIPTINVDKTCLLGDPTAFTESKGKRRVPRLMMADDGCMKSELSALDDIIKQWTDFTRGERALCIAPRVYAPSYVEWLTCLELQRDVLRLRQQSVEPKRKG